MCYESSIEDQISCESRTGADFMELLGTSANCITATAYKMTVGCIVLLEQILTPSCHHDATDGALNCFQGSGHSSQRAMEHSVYVGCALLVFISSDEAPRRQGRCDPETQTSITMLLSLVGYLSAMGHRLWGIHSN